MRVTVSHKRVNVCVLQETTTGHHRANGCIRNPQLVVGGKPPYCSQFTINWRCVCVLQEASDGEGEGSVPIHRGHPLQPVPVDNNQSRAYHFWKKIYTRKNKKKMGKYIFKNP